MKWRYVITLTLGVGIGYAIGKLYVSPSAPAVKRPVDPPSPREPMVYVTPSGERYHREDCQTIAGIEDKSGIPLSDAKVDHTPCAVCTPPV